MLTGILKYMHSIVIVNDTSLTDFTAHLSLCNTVIAPRGDKLETDFKGFVVPYHSKPVFHFLICQCSKKSYNGNGTGLIKMAHINMRYNYTLCSRYPSLSAFNLF